jgi:hypothetical protein
MRKLIQQLGEAIHDSVSESELIAGVVQDIRKHGFDVLLMLEATIGLNEVEQQPPSLAAASEGVSEVKALGTGEGGSFTQQDVKFLRSLRISVEGEARSQNGEDTLDRNGDHNGDQNADHNTLTGE